MKAPKNSSNGNTNTGTQPPVENPEVPTTGKLVIKEKKYDYNGAIQVLKSFSGNMKEFPALEQLITAYEDELATLVQWTDFAAIPNLSFEMLIADPQRAFIDAIYASSYKKNFITTDEFRNLLSQLYAGGYVLVDMDDLVEESQIPMRSALAALSLLEAEGIVTSHGGKRYSLAVTLA